MRKIASIALLAFAAGAMAQQSDELRVKFNNASFGNSLVALYADKHDTITAKKAGKYDFTIKLTEPTKLFLKPLAEDAKGWGFSIVAVPGNTLEVKLTNKYEDGWTTISGTGFYKNYNEVDTLMYFAKKPMTTILTQLQSRIAAGEKQEAVLAELQPKYREAYVNMENRYMKYINEHPSSETATLLIPELGDLNTIRQAVDILTPEVRNGRMRPIFMAPILEAEARAKAEAEAAKKQAAGVDAPDFTLNDINGNPLRLSDLRGKYVLLDFWGSWCVWCIKGMPKMKEYYAKYAGKYEILGIDCNDPEDKWKAAVEKHELPWLHVYCPRDKMGILQEYGIQGFPTKILIDPEGKIDKTIVGEDPAFYDYLDEKFGK